MTTMFSFLFPSSSCTENLATTEESQKQRQPMQNKLRFALPIIVGVGLLLAATIGGIGLGVPNAPTWITTIGQTGQWPFWTLLSVGGLLGISFTAVGIYGFFRKKEQHDVALDEAELEDNISQKILYLRDKWKDDEEINAWTNAIEKSFEVKTDAAQTLQPLILQSLKLDHWAFVKGVEGYVLYTNFKNNKSELATQISFGELLDDLFLFKEAGYKLDSFVHDLVFKECVQNKIPDIDISVLKNYLQSIRSDLPENHWTCFKVMGEQQYRIYGRNKQRFVRLRGHEGNEAAIKLIFDNNGNFWV